MDQVSATGEVTTLIHLIHEGRIPCMPNMVEFHATVYHPAYHRSDDTRAVTCPACKKTPTFKHLQDTLNAALHRRATSGG